MIEWSTSRGLVTLETRQWLPRPLDRVFPFFADAGNLEAITPPWLNFRILTPRPIPTFPGAMIEYELRLHRVPLRWATEITEWEPPRRFVDTQRVGPFLVWIHQHEFTERDGGTEVRDAVRYAVPGGLLIDRLLVRRDVRRIFEHRARMLAETFGSAATPHDDGRSERRTAIHAGGGK